ncbi:S-methyl-5-thioribose-1-phosphate isomerase [Planctomyces sp. SH-PL62]|uniref:S-methyl-5-thioribose-1-phosphate isomerase n=1 Tax=Planctomyces sp. SH-PL62 TaxID=1636152 RepID=UPI00078E360E|nr:S-methyl-5-thioribose-1-phosphate isomerase [Planctomyces sp. SH-PL62]AMV39675.1 Methylthioribose-1-phosphate isomerase [Planctomyces sp. SH-PL62]
MTISQDGETAGGLRKEAAPSGDADRRDPGVFRTVHWVGDAAAGRLRMIDQTRLPSQFVEIDCDDVESVWGAIKRLSVRGAPAIGVAAAYGAVIGARSGDHADPGAIREALRTAAAHLRTSRPTAVNLFWALDRMEAAADAAIREPRGPLLERLLDEAHAIAREDRAMCREIGRFGAELIEDDDGVLTHCNAGGLATADYGTALAVIFSAHEQGKSLRVFADETRPLLQGARLTAWELVNRGIDVTLICDNMAAQVMKEGKVRKVVVGADRIAANGDAANKIGTYGVALLAKAHGIPFYVAAPSSTFDLTLADGSGIPIEERDPREVTEGFGLRTAPEGVAVYNPAFDVTPADLITGIITERGVIRPVDADSVRRVLGTPKLES